MQKLVVKVPSFLHVMAENLTWWNRVHLPERSKRKQIRPLFLVTTKTGTSESDVVNLLLSVIVNIDIEQMNVNE